MTKRPIEQLERELQELPPDERVSRDIGERLLEELGWHVRTTPDSEAETVLRNWCESFQQYPLPLEDDELEERLAALKGDGSGDILSCSRTIRVSGRPHSRSYAEELADAFGDRKKKTLTGWIVSADDSVDVTWWFHEGALTPGLLLDFAQAEAALRREVH